MFPSVGDSGRGRVFELERSNLFNADAVGGGACMFLTSDPKPRLRWTAELHERFVDAVTQLGGPDSNFLI